MTIKPSTKTIVNVVILSFMFVFISMSLGCLVIYHQIFLLVTTLASLITAFMVAIAFIPALVESIKIENGKFIHQQLFSKKCFSISEINEIHQRVWSRYGSRLIIQLADDRVVKILYKKYSEDDVKALIDELLKRNPKIVDNFTKTLVK